MPTYEYACNACGHGFEIVQSFSDDALTQCPQCKGELRKIFNSVGVVFKGSGFYRTDSRNGSTASESTSSAPASSSAPESSSSSSASPSTQAPASSDSTKSTSAKPPAPKSGD
ncbi:MAG: FmdB family transcriptional regulator [Actinobacteria bacterium]|nr:FmdB family transcriptional regulator [Actinomycetota bacterium]